MDKIDSLFHAARPTCDAEGISTTEQQKALAERVDYGFETRMMARLREERNSTMGAWAWRLAPVCGVMTLVAILWSQSPGRRGENTLEMLREAGRQYGPAAAFLAPASPDSPKR